MKKLYVLLDNGHGIGTPGKRSPKFSDGRQFFEYKFCREIVNSIYDKLSGSKEFIPVKITPELNDIGLGTRVKRINQYCAKYGSKNCIIISVHVNAAGKGSWMSGRGWSAWTTPGVTVSDRLAECLYEGAEVVIKRNIEYTDSFKGQKTQRPIRTDMSDGDRDYEAGFQILRGANCAAVLTENFFMDNSKDCTYLMSQRGHDDVVEIHLEGIKRYYSKYIK